MVRPGNVAASRDSSRRLGARRGPVALLLLAALAPATAVGQRAPQPVFTELFAYDRAERGDCPVSRRPFLCSRGFLELSRAKGGMAVQS